MEITKFVCRGRIFAKRLEIIEVSFVGLLKKCIFVKNDIICALKGLCIWLVTRGMLVFVPEKEAES